MPAPGYGGFCVHGRNPDMDALTRLFAYAREHQEQARSAGNELRVEQWNSILDKLIDRCTLAKLMKGKR